MAEFIRFYIGNAPQLVAEVGYIPLPAEVYRLAQGRFENRKIGSVFGGTGSKVGVTLASLLSSESR